MQSQVMGGEGNIELFYTPPALYTALNSEADDYAPTYDPVLGRLLFASERSGSAMVYTGESPKPIAGTFNLRGQHRAFLTFTESGEVFGALFLQQPRQSYQGIVSVLRSDDALNAGIPIASLHGDFFASHPAVSPDGTRLVFASDKEGSAQLDFWVSERTTERVWSEPVLLSPLVNSEANEITPFFISNDSLIYASNGYGGKGGYDLFLTVYQSGSWQEPEPLEWLNSEFDDSDAAMLPDGTIVFASNRPGGQGGLDLYLSRMRSTTGNH